jgi:hypothetical protein
MTSYVLDFATIVVLGGLITLIYISILDYSR